MYKKLPFFKKKSSDKKKAKGKKGNDDDDDDDDDDGDGGDGDEMATELGVNLTSSKQAADVGEFDISKFDGKIPSYSGSSPDEVSLVSRNND